MGIRTISLSDEAYERVKAAKREGERFSDVVNRIFPGVRLEGYWGILDDQAAEELRETVETGRERRRVARTARRDRIAAELASDGTDHEQ